MGRKKRKPPRADARRRREETPAPLLEPVQPPRLREWVGACAFVALIYTLPLAGNLPAKNPNELSRIDLTVAMVHDGAISLDGVAAAYGGLPQDHSKRAGKAYSDKAPGLSFLAVPAAFVLQFVLPNAPNSDQPDYWPLRHALTWLMIVLPAALLPFLMLRGHPAAGGRKLAGYAVVVALVTPLLTYATVFFGHLPAAVLVTAAFIVLLRPGRPDYVPGVAAATLSGVLIGFAVGTEYPTVVAGLALFASLLIRRYRWRVFACFVVGGVIGVLPVLIYHHVAFGAAWTTGYAFKGDLKHAAVHAQGLVGVSFPSAERLWGVLLGAKRGLLYYCPLLWLAPLGLAVMARRCRRDFWPLLLMTLGFLFFTAGFVDWQGGWSAAARHFTPALPLLAFAIVEAIEVMRRRLWSSVIVTALAGMSACGALLSVAVTPFFPETFTAPLSQAAMRSLADGAALPNLLTQVLSVPPVWAFGLIAVGVLAAVAFALVRVLSVRRGAVWIPAVLVVAALSYAAAIEANAKAPTPRQEVTRARFVLWRLGYIDLAKKVDEAARRPTTLIP
ncbi:MAG: hypothetical protein V3T70_01390 [Phycisphaerae bacterium]